MSRAGSPARRASPIRPLRALAAAALVASAAGAWAYLPPATAILKRVAQRREDLALGAIEARGTIAVPADVARRLALAGADAPGTAPASEVSVPAVVAVKIPGRCRLELAPPGVAPADRPSASVKAGRFTGHRGLDGVPAARALVEGICTLIGEKASGPPEPERALAQALASRGVALADVALGRIAGRVAWVLGGRPQDARPQAWIDKATFQPVRLVAPLAGSVQDVRLVDFGSPVGGDAFPRALEVWTGTQLQLRFSTERTTQNPKLPDVLF
ncbi:MAG TPA: hypothetical protein VFP65_11080 [Anaeromyxobacteraceae bacterium]|nr:hypothetical protein [Anaeromyxobacteraceae bacterium]